MTRPRALAPVLLLVVPGLLALVSCGEDDPYAAYCEEVEAQQPLVTEALAGGAATGLIAALPSFEALAAEAPDDIADDWSVVTRRLTVLRDALDAAGVDPATYDRDDPPAGLAAEDRGAIDAAARELTTPAMQTALSSVEQQARDVCSTPLSR